MAAARWTQPCIPTIEIILLSLLHLKTLQDPNSVILFAVCFISAVETAIRRPHTVEGHEVTVQRYPVPVMIPEVFDHVRARLNCNIFDSTDMLGNVVEQLQRECGVDYKKSSSGIYITGSFVQIKDCHKYILDLIQSKHHQDVSRSNFAEEASNASITTEEPHFQIKNTVKEIKDVVYQTVPIVFKFILSVSKYRRQLEQIKKDHKVNIREIDSGNKVTIQPLHRCTQKDFDEACEEYINLYREVYDGPMLSKEMVLKPGPGAAYFTAQEAIDEVLCHAPVIIQSTATQDTWLFYGEEKQVKLAMEEICKKLKIEYPFKRGRKHIDDSGRHDMEGSTSQRNLGSDKENLQPGTSSDADKKFPASESDERREEYLTKKGFKLSVSQGDITEEQVDIIVNCNDDYLTGFSKGLPKAIVDKGGREIQLEAVAHSKKRILKAGEIIMTKAGNLYCSKVMHIIASHNKKNKVNVLKNMVKDACLDCLRRAKYQNSIAFPAVGANKVGLSLQDCATAMLNGVEEYMKTGNPKTNIVVADIRFIHLNPDAFEVFRQELSKRFGAPTTERGADPRERNRAHDQHSATRPTENRNGTPTGKLITIAAVSIFVYIK
ncbi:hypothetical protein QZH41_017806 [Actinostola sp. cb2023]|nr:hypothetical protein QZH41_017806 [Actinostola sp. cb2023]